MEVEKTLQEQKRAEAIKQDPALRTLQTAYENKLQELQKLKAEAANREDYDKVQHQMRIQSQLLILVCVQALYYKEQIEVLEANYKKDCERLKASISSPSSTPSASKATASPVPTSTSTLSPSTLSGGTFHKDD